MNFIEAKGEDKIPRHVAIVMDGNRRWATVHNKPQFSGHRAGAEALRKIVQAAAENNIEVLSVFAFSSENWRRPHQEVKYLMKLFLAALKNQIKELNKHNIQLRVIGDIEGFSEELREYITKAETSTKANYGLKLIIAANYGGQWDILQAVRKISQMAAEKKLAPTQITSEKFAACLTTEDIPYPDLFIRTSGETRISNFFLWQLAYSELYFTKKLWPDFDEKDFAEALKEYAKRERRFGDE